ncbi:UDP-4-amino-4,6-dideoxy-N-acetyl-beta-L-altrosamine N-acetyltransferase [Qipengyuania sp. DGS5-3]|uniref:UDP-4-amino-4, 6-dideoxy-N-acetyl-beta-L-altrosamine N-acetyltransferase n=1 Tax=Qipengyuania sp. DGS5-3 TaxID=3349632 RepID=UPI0036D411C2
MTQSCLVRQVQASDLAQLRAWRNHASIRAFMLTQHEIAPEEHEDWFAQVSADHTRRLILIEQAGAPIGYAQFSGVEPLGVSDWGFYARPHAPKGSGKMLGIAALDFAFEALDLHKVRGQALALNEASIAMHLKLGFEKEGVFREDVCVKGEWHDLICFGLLKSTWNETRDLR